MRLPSTPPYKSTQEQRVEDFITDDVNTARAAKAQAAVDILWPVRGVTVSLVKIRKSLPCSLQPFCYLSRAEPTRSREPRPSESSRGLLSVTNVRLKKKTKAQVTRESIDWYLLAKSVSILFNTFRQRARYRFDFEHSSTPKLKPQDISCVTLWNLMPVGRHMIVES